MRTDDDLGNVKRDGTGDADEDNQEKSLQWLLEMDLSEPEESLFTVAGDEYHDEGLTAYEEQVAGRPLIRGNDAGDDLASYVDEVIVISSDSLRNGIYIQSEPEAVESAEEKRDEVMAIDYSRGRESESFFVTSEVDEGTDILGLSGDDDIGEKAVSIKRAKSRSEPRIERAGPIMDSAPVICEADESKLKHSLNGSESAPNEIHGIPAAAINLAEAPVPTQIANPSPGAGRQ